MNPRLAQGTPRFVGALWLAPLLVRRPTTRILTFALAAGTTWFFRDPERTPQGAGLLAAADGIVQWVRREDGQVTVSTYLDLLDVHVTRAPCDATVVAQDYRPGRHLPASHVSADANERLKWVLATEYGELVLTQYSGAVARRIVPYRASGDLLSRGDRIGLIRFGSRVDVTLPDSFRVRVRAGQRVQAGSTVLAEGEPR